MQKYGITAGQAGEGSPDARWLVSGGKGGAHVYAAGDRLPIGAEAFPGSEHNALVLWIEDRGLVILGDTLVDFGDGLDIPSGWLRTDASRPSSACFRRTASRPNAARWHRRSP